jgi:hypothetical protein
LTGLSFQKVLKSNAHDLSLGNKPKSLYFHYHPTLLVGLDKKHNPPHRKNILPLVATLDNMMWVFR